MDDDQTYRCSCGGKHTPLDIDLILSLLSNKDKVIHDGSGFTPSTRNFILELALKLDVPES